MDNNKEKLTLNCVSLFSGIEAFSVAASRIKDVNWNMVFFSEIDPFPCEVLQYHYPDVPNLGDICKIRADSEKGIITNGITTIAFPRGGIDILAGGSPCQDVSVAGKRAGMSEGTDTRSSLAFEYSRLVEELRPRILLWENVFGVLSSNSGRDFLAFQHSLVQRGYGICWRVLDAQYTRVASFPRAIPQRRRRVFLVGVRTVGRSGITSSGIAEILFEQPRLLGNTPPSRKTGQGFAAPAGYCVEGNDSLVGYPERFGATRGRTGGERTGLGGESGSGTGGIEVQVENHSGVKGGCSLTGGDISPSIIASDYKGPGNTQDGKVVSIPVTNGLPLGSTNESNKLSSASGFRASSFGTFKNEEVSGTLDCDHCNGIANGTPCLITEPIGEKAKSQCLTPEHPMTHRVYDTGGAYPTIMSGRDSGQDMRAVLTETKEPLAFSQNQREEVRDLGQASGAIPAEGGSHQRTMICCSSPQPHSTTRGYGIEVAPTMGAAAGESGNNKPFAAIEVVNQNQETESVGIGRDAYNMGANAKFGMSVDKELSPPLIARGPNALATKVVHDVSTYENHAQDSRVQPIDVMPTMGHSNANSPGTSGNNPLIVNTVACDFLEGKSEVPSVKSNDTNEIQKTSPHAKDTLENYEMGLLF